MIGNIVAKGANATLVAANHPQYEKEIKSLPANTRYIPNLRVCGSAGMNVADIWGNYRSILESRTNSDRELPVFVARDALAFNYMYCNLIRRKWDSWWDFTIFTDPLDFWNWIFLLLSLILVSLVLSKSHFRSNIFSAFLASLAILLTNNAGDVRNSKLFVIWMMSTLILVNIYSGEITSQIVRPPPENVMTHWNELEENNYTIVFNGEFIQDIMTSTVSILGKNTFAQDNVRVMKRLLSNILLYPYGDDVERLIPKLIDNQRKVAQVSGWPFVMWSATTANHVISTKERKLPKGKVKSKKCYVGKDLIETGEEYGVFLPPGNAQFAGIYQKLVDAGIVGRWLWEFFAKAYAWRVQDRVRIINPVTILEEHATTIESMKLEGKSVTIFLLWIFCIVGCVLLFLGEMSWISGISYW